jgi:hypothetical protein
MLPMEQRVSGSSKKRKAGDISHEPASGEEPIRVKEN